MCGVCVCAQLFVLDGTMSAAMRVLRIGERFRCFFVEEGGGLSDGDAFIADHRARKRVITSSDIISGPAGARPPGATHPRDRFWLL